MKKSNNLIKTFYILVGSTAIKIQKIKIFLNRFRCDK